MDTDGKNDGKVFANWHRLRPSPLQAGAGNGFSRNFFLATGLKFPLLSVLRFIVRTSDCFIRVH
jgi:hypothetical protein